MSLQTEFVESRVLYKANKTGDWLLDQPDTERRTRITQARIRGRQLRQEDLAMRDRLNKEHRERLQMLREVGQKKDDKERGRFEKWLETMVQNGGLWEAADIAAHVSSITKTKAKQLLTAQINVRAKVLNTVLQDKIALSKASVEELCAYLLKLVEKGVPEDRHDLVDILNNPPSILGLEFAQKWAEKEGANADWCAGFVADYVDASHEYKLVYSDATQSVCFMQVDEVVTDVVMGNMDIHYV